jgi:hypothetical protein
MQAPCQELCITHEAEKLDVLFREKLLDVCNPSIRNFAKMGTNRPELEARNDTNDSYNKRKSTQSSHDRNVDRWAELAPEIS